MITDDSRIDDLIALAAAFVGQLASRMAELAVARDTAVRSQMQSEIQKLLTDLQQAIDNWIADSFREIVGEVQENFLEQLPVDTFAIDVPGPASKSIESFKEDVRQAILAISALASRLGRGESSTLLAEDESRFQAALAVGAAGEAIIASTRAKIQDRLQEGILQILGMDGKVRRYDLGYYLAMGAVAAKVGIQSDYGLELARRTNLDLVQVSKQPSTIGDYCDLYRGKVFSISGTHPIFPALIIAPNRGAPFHPWCRHTMSPFDESGLTAQQKLDLARIPKDFVELGKQGASVNAFQSLWIRSRKSSGA